MNFGGLPRRATFLKNYADSGHSFLLLGNGNMLSKIETYANEKATLIARSLSIMAYDAVNIGENEFYWYPTIINTLASTGEFPLLCADVQSTKMAWKPYVVKSYNGLRVGVVGVGGSSRIKGVESLSVIPPLKAVQKALIQMRQEADVVVLLSQLRYGDTLDILSRVDGVDIAIVGGVSVKPFRLKDTVVTSFSHRGEFVAALKLIWNIKSETIVDFSQEVHKLTKDYSPDERLTPAFDIYNAGINLQNTVRVKQPGINPQLIQKLKEMSPDEFMEFYKEQIKQQSANQGLTNQGVTSDAK